MTTNDIAAIEERLRRIDWYSATAVTAHAEELIAEHIRRMRAVFAHAEATEGKPPIEAYSDAQSAGYAADGHDELFDVVHDKLDFGDSPSKMPIVLTLVAHSCWQEDDELGQLANPWEPVVALFELGYTTTFEQDDDTETLDFVLEYPGHQKSYPLHGSGVPAAAR